MKYVAGFVKHRPCAIDGFASIQFDFNIAFQYVDKSICVMAVRSRVDATRDNIQANGKHFVPLQSRITQRLLNNRRQGIRRLGSAGSPNIVSNSRNGVQTGE